MFEDELRCAGLIGESDKKLGALPIQYSTGLEPATSQTAPHNTTNCVGLVPHGNLEFCSTYII